MSPPSPPPPVRAGRARCDRHPVVAVGLGLGLAAALVLGSGAGPVPLAAQVLRGGVERAVEPVDTSDVLSRARREQARFERLRVGLLPGTWSRGGDCEEVVGRFCFWFGSGGPAPPAEPPEVGPLRDAFLSHLDSVQALLPDEGWLTGQRVWYLTEGRRPDRALDAALSCRAEPWWCAALRGFALHALGRYGAAEAAFQEALAAMEPERAERWRDLRWLLRGDARRALEESIDAHDEAAHERLWRLADPLLLVPGNERRAEHWARWTAATILSRSRNPFGIRWGRDMDELTVRMGWEISWERVRDGELTPSVVGHHHPDGRDFLPAAEAIRAPAEAPRAAHEPEGPRPRSVHAPGSAQLVLPMEGQVAVFPRGDSLVVVATHHLPADTTVDPGRDSLRARLAPPGLDTLAPRAGLFLLAPDGGAVLETRREGSTEGALLLRAPAGRWVAGVEAWAPALHRAGRHRRGVSVDTVPPDVPTLSDLLLLAGAEPLPRSLEDAPPAALSIPEAVLEAPLAVAWELNGVGWHPGEVTYELSVERADVGILRRLGQALGVVDRDRPLVLSWSEPLPDRPGPVFRAVALEGGSAGPGRHRVTLSARLPGRAILVRSTELTWVPGPVAQPPGRGPQR